MPALVAGIHALPRFSTKDVDYRDKPGHDGAEKCLNEIGNRSMRTGGPDIHVFTPHP